MDSGSDGPTSAPAVWWCPGGLATPTLVSSSVKWEVAGLLRGPLGFLQA